MQSSAESLLTVINDILDFSKIEARMIDLSPDEFSIPDLVADIMKTLVHRAHDKGLELAYRIGPEVP